MEGMMGDFEEERSRRRQERIESMRRQKRQQQLIRRAIIRLALPIAALLVVVIMVITALSPGSGNSGEPEYNQIESDLQVAEAGNAAAPVETKLDGTENLDQGQELEVSNQKAISSIAQSENVTSEKVYSAKATDRTTWLGSDLVSTNAVLIQTDTGEILARKGETERISPASMTKVLTVLVAAEHVTDLNDTFTITTDITDYSYVNDCSNVGFAKDETVTVRDLFYGTVLPSGADAAAGLAIYVAGSLDGFVELMNDKLEELGLSDSAHFTNCVGLYDEQHYCTVYDMAMIMEAALDNELCREVLSAHKYTTSETPEHPEGITISNWFLRRIEDKDAGGEVLSAKTGFVVQSKNCAVSYATDKSGSGYVCVTTGATSAWRCIYDHVDIYKQFLS